MPVAAALARRVDSARHDLVKHDSKREHAGPFTKLGLVPLFGCHVRARTSEHADVCGKIDATKVRDQRAKPQIGRWQRKVRPQVSNEDVLRLEVLVNQAATVTVRETRRKLDQQRQSPEITPTRILDEIGQIALPPPEKGDGRAKDKDNVKGPMYVRVIMRRRLQLDLTQEALRTFSW